MVLCLVIQLNCFYLMNLQNLLILRWRSANSSNNKRKKPKDLFQHCWSYLWNSYRGLPKENSGKYKNSLLIQLLKRFPGFFLIFIMHHLFQVRQVQLCIIMLSFESFSEFNILTSAFIWKLVFTQLFIYVFIQLYLSANHSFNC